MQYWWAMTILAARTGTTMQQLQFRQSLLHFDRWNDTNDPKRHNQNQLTNSFQMSYDLSKSNNLGSEID